MADQPTTFASSTGQAMTGADYLDTHFEAARPEYEVQLRAVGIQPGWHVLDAASGSGSFLPWLADLVGSSGRLSALDLAADNVALMEERRTQWRLPCPVETQVGTVLDLRYSSDTFDAIWFANTSQYLTDDELATVLSEFQRVVRPGGLIAVKETDITMYRVIPGPPGLLLRWFEASAAAGTVQSAGTLRAGALPGWLRASGLRDVWAQTTLIERTAPLGPAVRTNWRDLLQYLAVRSTALDLSAGDRQVWASLGDRDVLERFLDDQNCWLIEANVLTVGTVAATDRA